MSTNQDVLRDIPQDAVERLGLDRVPWDRPSRSTADLLSLDGRVAIVTGGGGTGTGNAICHRLAEQGAAVAVFDVSAERAEDTAEQLTKRWGTSALPVAADVVEPAALQAAVSQVVEQLGDVDILVNNAGGSGGVVRGRQVRRPDRFVNLSHTDIEEFVRLNLMGTLHAIRTVLPGMLGRGRGRIVNISSEAAKVGLAGVSVYSAAKAGVDALTRSLAREIGPQGVSIVAVCPGPVATTTLLEVMRAGIPPGLEDALEGVSVRRFAAPDELASLVAYLASEAGAYLHGTSVSIGGGLSG